MRKLAIALGAIALFGCMRRDATYSCVLRDAGGIEEGAPVRKDGVEVGRVKKRIRDGGGARLTLALPANLTVWSNAVLTRRSRHLDLDPGADEGAAFGQTRPTRLQPGDTIANVVEPPIE